MKSLNVVIVFFMCCNIRLKHLVTFKKKLQIVATNDTYIYIFVFVKLNVINIHLFFFSCIERTIIYIIIFIINPGSWFKCCFQFVYIAIIL